MSWWLIPVSVAIGLHYVFVTRRRGFLTGDGIFVVVQAISVAGTLSIIDANDSLDESYVPVVCAPVIVYCLVSIFVHEVAWRNHPESRTRPRLVVGKPRAREWWLVWVSLAIVTLYFLAVGYNVLFIGLMDLLTGSKSDIATLRLESYSGNRYFAPGYVNQFKNSLLPALVVAIWTYLARKKSPGTLPFVVIFGGAALVGLLGTGQRGAFVTFCLVAFVYVYYLDPIRFPRRALWLAGSGLIVLLGSSLTLGRSSKAIAAAPTMFGKLSILWGEVWTRIVEGNQASGVAGWHYTSGLPTANGREWYQGLLGLSPFNRGSTLPQEIFKSLYGSDRGTSPPSMWGSVEYNFGVAGLVLVPVLLAIVNHAIIVKFCSRPHRDNLELLGFAGVFVVTGTWAAGGPEYLFNVGLVAYLFVIFLGKRRGKQTSESGSPLRGQQGEGSAGGKAGPRAVQLPLAGR